MDAAFRNEYESLLTTLPCDELPSFDAMLTSLLAELAAAGVNGLAIRSFTDFPSFANWYRASVDPAGSFTQVTSEEHERLLSVGFRTLRARFISDPLMVCTSELPDIRHPYVEYSLSEAVNLVNNERLFAGLPKAANLAEVRETLGLMLRSSGFMWITGMAAMDLTDAALGRDLRGNSRIC